jgi:septum formation protein
VNESLLLVSRSPRRAEILLRFGYDFRVVPPDDEPETSGIKSPRGTVLSALHKLESVELESGLALSADTVVWKDGRALGKPSGPLEARSTLRELSGSVHQVYTGFLVRDLATGESEEGLSRTDVTFASLSEEDLDYILASEDPLDKAGAYAIQGAAGLFVERIEGCYLNVVGLPMPALRPVLKRFGVVPHHERRIE